MAKAKNGLEQIATVSMTGFGRGQASGEALSIDVEIKSVNSRYLDLVFRLPREHSSFEMGLREAVGAKISRGRVEFTAVRKVLKPQTLELKFNRPLFDAYLKLHDGLMTEAGGGKPESRVKLVRELLLSREIAEPLPADCAAEAESELLLKAAEGALEAISEMRRREGARLGEDLGARLKELARLTDNIEKQSAGNAANIREKFLARVKKLASEVALDDARLYTEVATLADKADVTEEVVRLRAHLQAVGACLGSSTAGRKLDFLLQECGREFNTIASKAQDAGLQGLVVDAKSTLEKMREQAQNIE